MLIDLNLNFNYVEEDCEAAISAVLKVLPRQCMCVMCVCRLFVAAECCAAIDARAVGGGCRPPVAGLQRQHTTLTCVVGVLRLPAPVRAARAGPRGEIHRFCALHARRWLPWQAFACAGTARCQAADADAR